MKRTTLTLALKILFVASTAILGASRPILEADQNVGRSYMIAMSTHYEQCEALAWKSVDCEDDDNDDSN